MSFYFDPKVQAAIDTQLKRIMGSENKEDAIQEAYLAIADESPLTVDDACNCVDRAMQRYRKRISKISKHEERDQDSWSDNSEPYFNYNDSDEQGRNQYWWDYVAPRTPAFNKGNQRAIAKILHDMGRTY